MSSLSVAPGIVSAASGNLENLGSTPRSANAAASQTAAVAAPAADEVSAAITALFDTHAQALSAKAAAFHDEFANLLNGGAAQYVSTEAANVQRTLANAVNAPAQALLGHPLIGTGQGMAGAAANAADTVDLFGFNYPLGPFGVSLNVNEASFIDGGLALTGNAAVTLNTPFGSPVLVSGNVTTGLLADGSWFGNILETWPPGAWVTVDGTGFFSPYPVITGLAYNFDGLEFSFPGTTLFGPSFPM